MKNHEIKSRCHNLYYIYKFVFTFSLTCNICSHVCSRFPLDIHCFSRYNKFTEYTSQIELILGSNCVGSRLIQSSQPK